MYEVLLVEDHPLNRKLCRDILSMQFNVVEAASAEEALEVLESWTPDLILTDVQLPGMDGLTLVRRLKQRPALSQVPMVAISAHALPRDFELARAAGCLDYITKPITDDPLAFLARIACYFLRAGPGGWLAQMN